MSKMHMYLDAFDALPEPMSPAPETPARHAFTLGDLGFAPALFNYHHDHGDWEAVAYLLETELMYGKVVQAWGAGPHDEVGDFEALLRVCHSSSEAATAQWASDIWHRNGTIGETLTLLSHDGLDRLREALRIASMRA